MTVNIEKQLPYSAEERKEAVEQATAKTKSDFYTLHYKLREEGHAITPIAYKDGTMSICMDKTVHTVPESKAGYEALSRFMTQKSMNPDYVPRPYEFEQKAPEQSTEQKSADDIIKEQNDLIREFSELQKAQNEAMQEMMNTIDELKYRVDHPVRAGFERVQTKCVEFGQYCAEQYNHLIAERDKLFASAKEIAHTADSYVAQEAVAMRNSAVGTYNKCLEDISAQMRKLNDAVKNMISNVKSFVNDVKAKAQNITTEIAYRFEKHDLEACVKSIGNLIAQDSKRVTRLSERLQSCQNFDMALYEAKRGISNAFHRLNGEPIAHIEYTPSPLFAKIQSHMQENIQSISNDLEVWKHHHNEFSQDLQNLKDDHDNR